MASWSLVGSVAADMSDGLAEQSVSLPGGTAENDIVIVAIAADGNDNLWVTTSGYTTLWSSGVTQPTSYGSYKIMGSTPDTIVDIDRHVAFKQAAVVQVWRGVNTSSPIDVVSGHVQDSSPSNTMTFLSRTTVSNDALRIIVGHLDDDDTTVNTISSGYTNLVQAAVGTDDVTGATVFMASKIEELAGAATPGSTTMNSVDRWYTAHFALEQSTGPHPFSDGTRLTQMGIMGRPYAGFVAKTAAAGGSGGSRRLDVEPYEITPLPGGVTYPEPKFKPSPGIRYFTPSPIEIDAEKKRISVLEATKEVAEKARTATVVKQRKALQSIRSRLRKVESEDVKGELTGIATAVKEAGLARRVHQAKKVSDAIDSLEVERQERETSFAFERFAKQVEREIEAAKQRIKQEQLQRSNQRAITALLLAM